MLERIGNMGRKLSSRQAVARAALVATSVLLLGSTQARANTINWVASVGDITNSSNWQGNVLPGLNDIADINNAGEAQIGPGEGFTAGEIRVGDSGGSGFGILTQTGGTITATNWFVVGRFTNGNYNFEGGTMDKTGGGEFLIAGGNSSQVGVMTMSGTASLVMSNSGTLADGDSEFNNNQGNAQLLMQDSSSIDTGGSQFWIGNNTGCTGYLDMTGGTITDSTWMSVGRTGGTGSVDLHSGTINKTGNNGTHLIIGDSNNGSAIGTGVINQFGGAVNSAASDVWLGSNGVGTYNISGGTFTSLALDIGINGGSSGTLNLNGGSVSATILVAGAGSAAINFNGGVLQALASNASFLQNFKSSQINVQSAGAIFDTGGFNNTISAGLNGVGGLTLQGSSGSLTLNASNAYAGSTTVNGGTLIVGPSGTLGSNAAVNLNAGALAISSDGALTGKSLSFNGGALAFQNYNSSTISFSNTPNLMFGAATGIASAFAGQITGSGSLTYVGPGTLNLTNPSNTYSGGTFITNGVLQALPGSLGTGAISVTGTGLLGISSDASVPGSLIFGGGGLSFNNYSSALNFNPGLNLTLGAANGSASTLTGTIADGPSSATSLTYVGPGTLNLRGANTYTGGTNVSFGTLNFAASTLGSGAILLNGGMLQYATGNTDDITSSPFNLAIGALGGTIDTNGNNVSFAGNISPAATLGTTLPGAFQKSGAGTLTLNGTLSTSNILAHQGVVVLAGSATISTVTAPVSAANNFSSIGYLPGDNATLTLTGSSLFQAAGDLNIADQNASTGVLNIQDNAMVQVRTFYVAKSGTASGTINQTGGTLQEMDNGASSGDWRIGGAGTAADAGATGVYNLSGGNFNSGGANVQVGANGRGTFTQTGGSVSVGGFLSIGRFATGVGLYNMNSGNGVATASSQAVSVVGENGIGTLIVGDTSVFNTKELLIAQDDGAFGLVQQIGGTINAPNGVAIGQNQTGNLSLPAFGTYNLSGGVLATTGFSQFSSANVTSTVNFNGGTLLATQNNASLLKGITHANVQAGGLNLDASIGAVSISQALLHDPTAGAPAIDGGVTLIAGQLTMNGSANTYTGPTTISSGLLVAGAANSLSPFSTVNVSSGTLDVSAFANTIGGLIVGSAGNLNVGLGNILTVTRSAAFSGSLNITTGTASSSNETLIAYNSSSGTFANVTGIPSGDHLVYAPTALELVGSGPATLTWNNAGGNGLWDTITGNWTNGAANVSYSDTSNGSTGDAVVFNDANGGNYSVSISGVVHPSSVTFSNNTGNYTIAGATGSSGIAGTGGVTLNGTDTVTLSSSNSYTGGTTVNAGKLVLAGANAFPANTALNIATGASVQIANHSGGSSYMPVVSPLINNGTIDITNNAVVVHNASIGALTAEVASAYHNGQWNGTSASGGIITSSTAASDSTHLTAVGVATGLTSFQGGTVLPSDVLLKYTYYGDANLDGRVDGSDYSMIDNGYLQHLTGWQNGDFNYDSVVNGSDYTLIDNAFNSQGASLAAEVASPTDQIAGGTSAVPEPASISLLAMSGIALLGRRRRR